MPGYEVIGKEERDAVCDIFDKGGILSRYGWAAKRQNIFRVEMFEKEFAKKFNAKYSLAVSSGTAALKTVLEAFGVGPGDEVITQSHTFIATVEAILEVGAKPVITDINKTLNMDPEDLRKKITDKTKAIIPVHMAGVSCQMDEILALAKKHDLWVLEDNAQSLGGEYKGKKLATLGDAGIFSFDFGKMLTTGEGGMILTDNEGIFKRCREYSDHGHECNPNFPRGEDTRSIGGFNFKMMELQGAVGLAQLKKFDYVISQHRKNKQRIREEIIDAKGLEFRERPDPKGDTGDSISFFFKTREKTKQFVDLWRKKGYSTKNLPDALNWHFAGTWDHILNKYEEYQHKTPLEVLKKSDEILRKAVTIPVNAKMTDEGINKIISSVKEITQSI